MEAVAPVNHTVPPVVYWWVWLQKRGWYLLLGLRSFPGAVWRMKDPLEQAAPWLLFADSGKS